MIQGIITFTIIDALDQSSKPIQIDMVKNEPVNIRFPEAASIDSQQLAELGALLMRLADRDYDRSSILELLDGYGLQKNYDDSISGVVNAISDSLPHHLEFIGKISNTIHVQSDSCQYDIVVKRSK